MRARNIKPGFFKNELLGTADPLLSMLFAGLWTLADRDGRLEDRPLRIKAEIFPYRENLDVNGSLTELERMGFIFRYESPGCAVIQILNFRKHQTPHKTERAGVLPAPPDKPLENNKTGSASVKPPDQTGGLPEPRPPDSLIPDSPIPDSQLGARDDFFKKCFEYIVGLFPALMTANPTPIHQWQQAAYDFGTQVKPVVDSAAAKKAQPRSFKFFTPAITEAATALPKANGHGSSVPKSDYDGMTREQVLAQKQRQSEWLRSFQDGSPKK